MRFLVFKTTCFSESLSLLRLSLSSIILLLLSSTLSAQQKDIVSELFNLPDLTFRELEPLDGVRAFELRIRQPLDHTEPSKGHFYQRAYLRHVSFDQPTVIVTEGYSAGRHRPYEITTLLEANQIQVEHRYFGESMPDSLDYRYLNLEQATADYHHFRELFGALYSGKWLSTGISKGGSTTIAYRYAYPEDIEVSVPVVAPINDEFEEDRIYQFLDTVGTPECRAAILELQRGLLKRRSETKPRILYFAKGAGATFDYLTPDQAFEFSVLEYPFSFWQWGADCSTIPSPDAPIDTLLDYFLSKVNITFFGDDAMKNYASHYYQSAQQMGYYGYETHELNGLLEAFAPGDRPHAAFTPDSMQVVFSSAYLDGLNAWLQKDANQMIYIYGANDTWTASAVQPQPGQDSEWFFLKDKSHGDARIRNLTTNERVRLIAALERWLDVEIE